MNHNKQTSKMPVKLALIAIVTLLCSTSNLDAALRSSRHVSLIPELTRSTQEKHDPNLEGRVRVNMKIVDGASVAEIALGTPKQKFTVLVDSSSSNFWISSVKCTDSTCNSHAKYDSSKSSSYKQNGKTIDVDYANGSIKGFVSIDSLAIGDVIVENVTFVEATSISLTNFDSAKYDGVLGLGFGNRAVGFLETVVESMVKAGLLERNVFSIDMHQNQPSGELVLGGIDYKPIVDAISYTPLVGDDIWFFEMDHFFARGNGHATSYGTCDFSCDSFVDTNEPLIVAPKGMAAVFAQNIGASLENDVYVLKDCQTKDLPELVFVVNRTNFILEPEDYLTKRKDSKGQTVCVSPFVDGSKRSVFTLGQVFLRKFYAVFDLENQEVGFAPKDD